MVGEWKKWGMNIKKREERERKKTTFAHWGLCVFTVKMAAPRTHPLEANPPGEELTNSTSLLSTTCVCVCWKFCRLVFFFFSYSFCGPFFHDSFSHMVSSTTFSLSLHFPRSPGRERRASPPDARDTHLTIDDDDDDWDFLQNFLQNFFFL